MSLFTRFSGASPASTDRELFPLEEFQPLPSEATATSPPSTLRSRARPIAESPLDDDPLGGPGSPGSPESPESPKVHSKSPLFVGPPPPITQSVLLPSSSDSRHGGIASSLLSSVSSLSLYPRNDSNSASRQDAHTSAWRAFRRQEAWLEENIQSALDMQVATLLSVTTDSDAEEEPYLSLSESLYAQDGASVRSAGAPPIRQQQSAPGSVDTARRTLQESLREMYQLRQTEASFVQREVDARRQSLQQIDRMVKKRDSLRADIREYEEEPDESTHHKLSLLQDEQTALAEKIAALERQLALLKRRHHDVSSQIAEVHDQRTASLSGFKGALYEAETAISTFLQNPPIKPLTLEVRNRKDDNVAAVGQEFLGLATHRRTVDMIKQWFTSDLQVLDEYDRSLRTDLNALREGMETWTAVIRCIATYEADVREFVLQQHQQDERQEEQQQQQLARDASEQVQRLDRVLDALLDALHKAERNRWKPLICAISAEIEALSTARHVFIQTFAIQDLVAERPQSLSRTDASLLDGQQIERRDSDNSVPSEFLREL